MHIGEFKCTVSNEALSSWGQVELKVELNLLNYLTSSHNRVRVYSDRHLWTEHRA